LKVLDRFFGHDPINVRLDRTNASAGFVVLLNGRSVSFTVRVVITPAIERVVAL